MSTFSQPLVSVIVNCHNGEAYLKEALDSVYDQTYKNWEIIFWDNASTDNSKFITQSYNKKLKYFFSCKLLPLGYARNLAVGKANGKYITFLDADDYYFPNKLVEQVRLMESYNYVFSYSGLVLIDADGKRIGKIQPRYKSGNIFSRLLCHYEINMPTVMLRTNTLKNHALKFDASLKFAPDYHLFMHIAALYKVGIIKNQLVCYRRHSNSLTYKNLNLIEKEQKYVIDSLRDNHSTLYKKYKSYFNRAYNKLCISRVKLLIYEGRLSQARKQLINCLFLDKRCIPLFILLLLPKNIFNKIVKHFKLNIPIVSV